MAGPPVFPVFVRIENQTGPSAASSFTAFVNKLLAAVDRPLRDFADRTRTALSEALKLPPNALGASDLNVDGLRQQAAAAQSAAAAARAIAEATAAEAQSQGVATREQVIAIATTEKFAQQQEQAAAATRALAHALPGQRYRRDRQQHRRARHALHRDRP